MQDVFLTPSILPLFSTPLEVFSCSPAVQGLSIDQPDKRPEIYSALPTTESSSSGTAPSLSAEEAIPHPALVFYRCNLHLSLSCSRALWDGEKLRGGNSLWEAWGAPFHLPFQKQQTPKGGGEIILHCRPHWFLMQLHQVGSGSKIAYSVTHSIFSIWCMSL